MCDCVYVNPYVSVCLYSRAYSTGCSFLLVRLHAHARNSRAEHPLCRFDRSKSNRQFSCRPPWPRTRGRMPQFRFKSKAKPKWSVWAKRRPRTNQRMMVQTPALVFSFTVSQRRHETPCMLQLVCKCRACICRMKPIGLFGTTESS